MKTIFFQATSDDAPYLPLLKPIIQNRCNIRVNVGSVIALTEIIIKCKEYNTTSVITTSSKVLDLLLNNGTTNNSIDDYAGSIIKRMGVEFLILFSVERLVTTPWMKFYYTRMLKKFTLPNEWLPQPEFTWTLFSAAITDDVISIMEQAAFIAVDIETVTLKDNDKYGKNDFDPNQCPVITCAGFTAVLFSGNSYQLFTVVIPYDDPYNIAVAGVILSLKTPKAFQNGKYDNAYFIRYNQPVINYCLDTINLFHCWYSELPKDLGFITAFCLRSCQYWKDDKKTFDIMEYYKYNARDCFNTALCIMALLQEIPDYAKQNYLLEFPLVNPCILAEATGIKYDEVVAKNLSEQVEMQLCNRLVSIRTMVGNKVFNPGSWQQVQKLFQILGSSDIKKTDTKHADKVMARHPLNKKIVGDIVTYREEKKLLSSYFKTGVSWNGRVFYTLNPHGTDTGRLASRESAFWCGLQIQNIPRDPETDKDIAVKSAFIADEGFHFGECDYEQAEARDTAYLSGDTRLISAIDDITKDFHGTNSSNFFGIPYDNLVSSTYDERTGKWVHQRLNKVIINLSKRVTYGTQYNMTAATLLDTMGNDNIVRAKILLKLPEHYTLKEVAQYLLDCYDKAYPVVRGANYENIKTQIETSRKLVSAFGWTRYCFGDPSKSKQAMNAYAAHPPQNLNAGTLNKAFLKVFYNVWLPNSANFKFCAQIHDSILFQYRIGYEHLAWQVKELMEFKVKVKDSFNITRELLVPAALKGGASRWSDIKALKN